MKELESKLEGISRKLEVLQKKVDQPSPITGNDEDLIAEARNSLLDHFSSKSTNQTTILLTLALLAFGSTEFYHAQLLPSRFVNDLSFTFGLGVIGYLMVRAVGRLLYWGGLADGILRVEMWDQKEVQKLLNEDLPPDKARGVKFYPTFIVRLYHASAEYNYARALAKNTWSSLMWRFTNSKWFALATVIAVSSAIDSLLVFSLCTGTW